MRFEVPDYVSIPFCLGMMIPAIVASLAGGFILGSFIWGRVEKTTLGIYIRHWCALHRPRIFFPEDTADERMIVETIKNAIASGKLKLENLR